MSPRTGFGTGSLVLGIIAGEALAAAAGEQNAPDWIRVTPRGPAQTRDGRFYTFDPETLASKFSSEGVDIALDLDHAISLRASRGERADAVGWANQLSARTDGTWAKVDWLDAGKAVLKARTHRYVSPTIFANDQALVTGLHSIALVSAPALSMPALLSALGYTEPPSMKQIAKALSLGAEADEAACLAALKGRVAIAPIAKALGLAETSDEAACLAAIGSLATKKVDGGALVEQLQAQLTTTTNNLAALQKSTRDKDVAELLEGALKARKIMPAQREHLAGLCATDDGLKQVRAMLAATVPGLQDSDLDNRQPGTGDQDPAQLAATATRLQKERADAGQPIGYAEAVALAAQKKG